MSAPGNVIRLTPAHPRPMGNTPTFHDCDGISAYIHRGAVTFAADVHNESAKRTAIEFLACLRSVSSVEASSTELPRGGSGPIPCEGLRLEVAGNGTVYLAILCAKTNADYARCIRMIRLLRDCMLSENVAHDVHEDRAFLGVQVAEPVTIVMSAAVVRVFRN